MASVLDRRDYCIAAIQWAVVFALRLALVLAGLVMVAVALPFRADNQSVSDGRYIVNLPRWAWIWGNDYDGLLGDKRGWWADNTPFGLPAHHWFSMWWWAAIRNPANNMRRLWLFSCPAGSCVIDYIGDREVEDDPGKGGWRFTRARLGKMRWYGFYLVKEWTPLRGLVVQIGFKIKPSHAGDPKAKEKGFTVEVNPWKDLD